MQATPEKRYLFVEDIAADLEEEDLRKVRRWITNEMPHERHGHRVKVLVEDFIEWKAGKRVDPRKAVGA